MGDTGLELAHTRCSWVIDGVLERSTVLSGAFADGNMRPECDHVAQSRTQAVTELPWESDLSDSIRGVSRMTATEAARSFSEVLNRVAAGEEIELTRSGAPVAVIGPPRSRLISATRLRELLASAPSPDADYAEDLRRVRESAGPPGDPWPS